MDTAQARKILTDNFPDIDLTDAKIAFNDLSNYGLWEAEDPTICLDGDFTPEQLRALAWWVETKQITPPEEGPGL